MCTGVETNTSTLIAEGGVSVVAVSFLTDTIEMMFPFLILSLALIIVDLFFGIEAAKKRYEMGNGEPVRLSRAIRRTTNKLFEYTCWVVLSSSLAVAFETPSLNWIILSIVVGNEVISIFTNWMFVHGKKVTGVQHALFSWLGDRVGADTSEIRIEDIDKKKKKRVKKEE